MASTTGSSVPAAVHAGKVVERARTAVAEVCAQPSSALREYVRAGRRHARGTLTQRDLDALLEAYRTWARHTGTPQTAQQLVDVVAECRAVRRQVDASYQVWWRWSETGRVWWLELVFHSRQPKALLATLSGEVRVRDLVRPGRARSPAGRRTSVLSWGASSYDYATVRPGISRFVVWPGAGRYVPTGPDGAFDVESVVVSTNIPGRRYWWCTLPVSATS